MVMFPKVYAMNMESPTLLVVDSTVVVVYPKVYVISTEGLANTWYVVYSMATRVESAEERQERLARRLVFNGKT